MKFSEKIEFLPSLFSQRSSASLGVGNFTKKERTGMGPDSLRGGEVYDFLVEPTHNTFSP
jgi:hypothetical protein